MIPILNWKPDAQNISCALLHGKFDFTFESNITTTLVNIVTQIYEKSQDLIINTEYNDFRA